MTTRAQRGAAVAAALGLAVLFHWTLLFGGDLHGYDWKRHFHYYDWIRISLVEHGTFPLFMPDALHSPNFAANPQSPLFGPLVWLLRVVPTGAYIKLLIVVYTAAGLAGMMALLADLGVSRLLALFASVTFAFSGYFVAHLAVGHHWTLGSYLLPGLLCLYRRAALGSRRALWGAAALDAVAILEGQHHPFLWQNLLLALFALLWAVERRDWVPVRTATAIGAAACGLAAVRLLPMVAEFHDYAPDSLVAGLPAGVLFRTLVTGGQDVTTQLQGIGWVPGSRWWEYAFYVGAPALGFIVVGVAAGWRRCRPLVAIGALCLVLSLAVPSLDVWAWLRRLPVLGSQRAPARFLSLALFCALVVSSVGAEALWERARRSVRARLVLPVAMAALLAWTAVDLWRASQRWAAGGVGTPLPSRSHRLERPVLDDHAGGTVTLEAFAPNRLVYAVEARAPAYLVLPLPYDRGRTQWRAMGREPVARGERLAFAVAAGRERVTLTYRPPLLGLGALLSAATVVGAGWSLRRRRRG
jgi:hypothetical protein